MSGAMLRGLLLVGRGARSSLGPQPVQARSGLGPQAFRAKRPITSTGRGGRLSKDQSSESDALGEMIKPTDFQKKVLVWGKIYPSIAEVPERVSSSRMKKARDLFRIRVNLLMGLATLIGCGLMIISGRMMRDSGDSLDARGRAQLEEWQKKGASEREEKKLREEEAAAKKGK